MPENHRIRDHLANGNRIIKRAIKLVKKTLPMKFDDGTFLLDRHLKKNDKFNLPRL